MISIQSINKLCLWLEGIGPSGWDDLIEKRTGGKFEDEWIRANNLLELGDRQWPGLEKAFMKISGLTKQHEIVDYIADDLDLIYQSEIQNVSDLFIARLKESYQNGMFPSE